MNKIEKMIKYIISTYSTAFPTRWSVLHHMFFVTGNGLHWSKSGELLGNDNYNTDEPITINLGQLDSLIDMKNQFASCQIPEMSLSFDVKIDFYTRMLAFTRKNIEDISTNNFYYFDNERPSIEQFSWGFSGNHLLTDFPKNIQSDYKTLIYEAVSIAMTLLIENSYKKNGQIYSSNDDFMLKSNWLDLDHMNNYFHLKSILERLI